MHILIAVAATTPHDFIITGDFNLHIDNISDPRTQQFMSLLENSNLTLTWLQSDPFETRLTTPICDTRQGLILFIKTLFYFKLINQPKLLINY